MSDVPVITCFECGRRRGDDLTDGFEAFSADEQQAWICGECVDRFPTARHFAGEMRRRFPDVSYFRHMRLPGGIVSHSRTAGWSWMTD